MRYEIALALGSGYTVWAFGPHPAGRITDALIFRKKLKKMLLPTEVALADKGYLDYKCVQGGVVSEDFVRHARARHENLNRRLKQFNVLSHRFRHSLDFHSDCFFAVASLTQIDIENGSTLFDM